MLLASDAFLGPPSLARRPHLDRAQTGLGPYYRLYETAKGWICIAAVTQDHRARLSSVMGVTLPPSDDGAEQLLEEAFRGRPALDWSERLDAGGVPSELSVEHTNDWYDDPDAAINGWVTAYEHPVWGRLEQPGTFIDLSETPGRIAGPPPMIGAHTREILSELGYSVLEMANLHEKGVVAW